MDRHIKTVQKTTPDNGTHSRTFSFKKHLAAGVKIYFITLFFRDIQDDSNLFIPKSSKLIRDINSALKSISKIKSRLDDFVCFEHPQRSDGEVINIYYGAVRDSLKRLKNEKA